MIRIILKLGDKKFTVEGEDIYDAIDKFEVPKLDLKSKAIFDFFKTVGEGEDKRVLKLTRLMFVPQLRRFMTNKLTRQMVAKSVDGMLR